MNYTLTELLFFLLLYSFLGWCMEVLYLAVRTGKFCNRGFFNLPLSLSYGIAADLLLLILPTLRGRFLLQFIACMVITSACAQLAGDVSSRLTRHVLWNQDRRSLYSGKLSGLIQALILSAAAMIVLLLIHPVLYIGIHMLPKWLLRAMTAVGLILLLLDFTAIRYTMKKHPLPDSMKVLAQDLQEQKKSLGIRLSDHIWKRLTKAYPLLQASDYGEAENQEHYVFAEGVCLDKLIWVFFICALGGDLIETVYVRLTAGIWMSRSSVLYGTFSIVWGFGAALLTLMLHRLADKEDRYIFLSGFFLGGTYEYLCSVFTEVFFGTTFWDYSDMPFNIGGRTNLLFCLFWGILSLVWLKLCYPKISRLIEKIPPMTGTLMTWICVALMCCDMVISGAAMIRYVERKAHVPAENAAEEFLDYQYPDALIEFVWPNLRIS